MKLERVTDELSEVIDRITKRESSINENMSDMGSEYKNKNEEFKKIES